MSFSADNAQEANGVVERDPFMVHGLVGSHWIKEWLRE